MTIVTRNVAKGIPPRLHAKAKSIKSTQKHSKNLKRDASDSDSESEHSETITKRKKKSKKRARIDTSGSEGETEVVDVDVEPPAKVIDEEEAGETDEDEVSKDMGILCTGTHQSVGR